MKILDHQILRIFSRVPGSKRLFMGSILCSTFAGLALSGLMTLIHRQLSNDSLSLSWPVATFFALWLSHGVFTIISGRLSTSLIQKNLMELRLTLARNILGTPLQTIEKIGHTNILHLFNDTLTRIAQITKDFSGFFTRLVTLAGLSIYLIWISPFLIAALWAFLALGSIFYYFSYSAFQRHHRLYHRFTYAHSQHFQALVHGIKELLQNRNKRSALLHRHMAPSGHLIVDLSIKHSVFETLIHRWIDMYGLLGIALMIFVLPHYGIISSNDHGETLVILLFIIPPLATVVSYFIKLGELDIALDELKSMELTFDQRNDKEVLPFPYEFDAISLKLDNLSFNHLSQANSRSFTLGPLNMQFHGGELIFFTGGNGSGKTTLAKLLCGLYSPSNGTIQISGNTVNDQNRESYRELFSVVFYDFHIFDTLLGLEDREVEADANLGLQKFRILDKVSVRGHEYSTTFLSQGQRKRLALLQAQLEDRPIILFDECAADQDPSFKQFFYREWIHELKQSGKLVIVITHDETYFSEADHLFHLEDGRIHDVTNKYRVPTQKGNHDEVAHFSPNHP